MNTHVQCTYILVHCIYRQVYACIVHTHMSTARVFRDEHTCPVHTHSGTFNLRASTCLHGNFVYIQTHMSNTPVD